METKTRMEVCVDSVESALAAEAGGADRVELCQALFEGGITPSAGLLELVRQRITIDLAVMIRPRGADFSYSDLELEVMKRDLQLAKDIGANVAVIGLLNPDGTVDRERTQVLIDLARPLAVTFHRAFDMTRDAHEALDTLLELGVDRVLTSGQERTAWEGLDLIVELVRHAGDCLLVVPGGGITERNVQKILRQSGAKEFHVSASASRESPMIYRNPRIAMGRQLGPPEYQVSQASETRVSAFRRLVD
jgi:copper homeostasis protein